MFTQSLVESVYHSMFPLFSLFILVCFCLQGKNLHQYITGLLKEALPSSSTLALFAFLLLNQFLLSQLQLLGYLKYYTEILWDIKLFFWLYNIIFYGFAASIFISMLPTTIYIFTTKLLVQKFQKNNKNLSKILFQIKNSNPGQIYSSCQILSFSRIIHRLNKEHRKILCYFQNFFLSISWALFASNITISFSIFACLVYTICQHVPLPTLYLTIINNISLYICLYFQGKVTDSLYEEVRTKYKANRSPPI